MRLVNSRLTGVLGGSMAWEVTVGTRAGPTGVEVYRWNKFWGEGTYKDSP